MERLAGSCAISRTLHLARLQQLLEPGGRLDGVALAAARRGAARVGGLLHRVHARDAHGEVGAGAVAVDVDVDRVAVGDERDLAGPERSTGARSCAAGTGRARRPRPWPGAAVAASRSGEEEQQETAHRGVGTRPSRDGCATRRAGRARARALAASRPTWGRSRPSCSRGRSRAPPSPQRRRSSSSSIISISAAVRPSTSLAGTSSPLRWSSMMSAGPVGQSKATHGHALAHRLHQHEREALEARRQRVDRRLRHLPGHVVGRAREGRLLADALLVDPRLQARLGLPVAADLQLPVRVRPGHRRERVDQVVVALLRRVAAGGEDPLRAQVRARRLDLADRVGQPPHRRRGPVHRPLVGLRGPGR